MQNDTNTKENEKTTKKKTARTPQEIKDVNEKNRFDKSAGFYKTKKRFIN